MKQRFWDLKKNNGFGLIETVLSLVFLKYPIPLFLYPYNMELRNLL